MRRSFLFAIAILAVLLLGLAAWFGSRPRKTPAGRAPVLLQREAKHNTPIRLPPATPETTLKTPIPIKRVTNAVENPLDAIPEQAAWEKAVDDILLSEGDETQKSQQLLALLPGLEEDAQVEVAQHAANLLSDESYGHASQILTNASMPEAVLSVLMTDLLNRSDELKLPIMLTLARTEMHPMQAEAKDLLEIYLQEDFGDDWKAWETALQVWLKENHGEN